MARSTTGGVLLSLSALAKEMPTTRETLAKRITAAGVQPSGEDAQGHPLWRLRDVLQAFYADRARDPDKLDPIHRKAHYQAENEKLQVMQRMRQLIPALDVERVIARIILAVARCFDTLPDVLERDAALTAAQVSLVERVLDHVREELRESINHDVRNGSGDSGERGAVAQPAAKGKPKRKRRRRAANA